MSLSAQNLELGYQSQPLVQLETLPIKAGGINCLIGPNGCGKSTLLRTLSGLNQPMAGRVTLDSTALPDWPRKKLARQLTILPQSPEAPNGITLGQLVSQGRFAYQGLLRRPSEEDRDACRWAMQVTGVSQLAARTFSTLSGGERQRGWIAMALAQQTRYLLLDEPNSFLDIGHQLEIMELLRHLNQQLGLTILIVLHEINHACQYADQLLVMRKGRLIASGSPQNIITWELLREVFQVEAEILHRRDDKGEFPYCLVTRSVCTESKTVEGVG
ncbi:MAG: ABC transporter ATP-binding protein [Marinobacterium sp.]|nr:ABC transporter ATP-binding protein [Marinobacterium sp.]